jgi:drug/metabolite transporter (DMT)-like permease
MTVRRRISIHPAILVSFFTLCWAVVELIGPATGVSAYQVVWTRYGVHLALLGLVFGPRERVNLVHTAQPVREVVCSLLMLGMPLCFIWALSRMSASDTLAVFWTAPLLIIAITALLGERFGGVRTIVAATAGLCGVVLIYRPDHGVLRPAALLAFGMALCFALYVVLMGSIRRDPVLVKLYHTALWVFIALTLVQPFIWHTPTIHGVVALVLIGALGCVGLYALDYAIEAASPAIIAPVFYTQLAWETMLGARLQLLREPRAAAGVLLVLLAAAMGFMWRGRTSPLPTASTERLSREATA